MKKLNKKKELEKTMYKSGKKTKNLSIMLKIKENIAIKNNVKDFLKETNFNREN